MLIWDDWLHAVFIRKSSSRKNMMKLVVADKLPCH